MAKLNDEPISFQGLTLTKIGEQLLEASSNKDGKGLKLVLNENEEQAFINAGGYFVGKSIMGLIVDAGKSKGMVIPFSFKYDSATRTFTTPE